MQKWFGGLIIVGAFALAAGIGGIARAQQPVPTACPSTSPSALGAQATPEPTECPSTSPEPGSPAPEPTGTMHPAF